MLQVPQEGVLYNGSLAFVVKRPSGKQPEWVTGPQGKDLTLSLEKVSERLHSQQGGSRIKRMTGAASVPVGGAVHWQPFCGCWNNSRNCLAASPAICHQALCSLSPAGVRDARSLAAAFNTRLRGRTVCCGNVKGWDASEALSARAMLSVSCLA